MERPSPRTLLALWQALVTAAMAATEATYILGPGTFHSMREAHQLADRLATHLSKMDLATALKARSRRYLQTHPTPETSYQASFWSRHVAQISHDTLLVTTMDSAASSAWTRRTGGSWLFDDGLINQGGFVRMESTHHGQHTLENQPLDYFVRARLTVVCAVLGAGINNFDCGPSPAVAPGTHNQSTFRFRRYRAGVMASGPAGAAALFKIIAGHHAQGTARVKVVIRTISSYAALARDFG